MKRVLVTGGSGFIGSNLVKKLLEKKYEIVIFDNGFRKGFGKVEEFNDKVTLVKGDVLNIHDWKKLPNDIDQVFHLAGLADIVPSIKNPKAYFDANLLGTLNVLEASKNKQVKKYVVKRIKKYISKKVNIIIVK